jgi:hypothetical protein
LQILEERAQLFFHLQQQQLIELIRAGNIEQALEFAQEYLAPRGEENVRRPPSMSHAIRCVLSSHCSRRTNRPAGTTTALPGGWRQVTSSLAAAPARRRPMPPARVGDATRVLGGAGVPWRGALCLFVERCGASGATAGGVPRGAGAYDGSAGVRGHIHQSCRVRASLSYSHPPCCAVCARVERGRMRRHVAGFERAETGGLRPPGACRELLEASQRQKTASELNAAILCSKCQEKGASNTLGRSVRAEWRAPLVFDAVATLTKLHRRVDLAVGDGASCVRFRLSDICRGIEPPQSRGCLCCSR